MAEHMSYLSKLQLFSEFTGCNKIVHLTDVDTVAKHTEYAKTSVKKDVEYVTKLNIPSV